MDQRKFTKTTKAPYYWQRMKMDQAADAQHLDVR